MRNIVYLKSKNAMKKNNLILLIVVLFWTCKIEAQESINACGSNFSGSGGSVAYSIGQVVYTTNTGSAGRVAQGVQHAYEIYTVGLKETNMITFITAYPNPSVDNLSLLISEHNNEKLSYQLYDAEGKLLKSAQIVTKQTEINTSYLPSASYYINIIDQENKKVQSFKIIKN
jgi:hypothetical protein